MKKTTVQLLDDLDGTVIENGSGTTVSFGFEGNSYEIDLSTENLTEFQAAMKPYTNVARRVGYVPAKTRATGSAGSDRAELQAIRAWAAANGMQVSDRGRIAGTVREAYANAQAK
ncbi:Lsr2 family protein [Cryobacterium sp. PH29-G1]|uniref:histone-like nucleoid-structuring protein Lsr2 n=1 Tax=Cryobacterium sp. PH29-G1 TaxID=3046211 RepID=UPI0024B91169|nr:Lsr2 family protein [Cryobacterium sp. PH29-G1]MDJ0350483.1 Lsr2 family protein [Cryobacterium sp. PH29-G1]